MSENLHAMDDDTLRRYAEWLGIPAETLRGLRDGSLVALPVGDRWTVARHHPTGTSEVTLHYRDDEFHRANAAEDVLAAAQEPPR